MDEFTRFERFSVENEKCLNVKNEIVEYSEEHHMYMHVLKKAQYRTY